MTFLELLIASAAMLCAARAGWLARPVKWQEPWIWGFLGLVLCDTVWLLRLSLAGEGTCA